MNLERNLFSNGVDSLAFTGFVLALEMLSKSKVDQKAHIWLSRASINQIIGFFDDLLKSPHLASELLEDRACRTQNVVVNRVVEFIQKLDRGLQQANGDLTVAFGSSGIARAFDPIAAELQAEKLGKK